MILSRIEHRRATHFIMHAWTPIIKPPSPGSLCCALIALACACSGQGPDSTGREYQIVAQLLPERNPDIDILFVIDSSQSMSDERESLARWADEFLFGVIEHKIELDIGLRPNLHIGVISTNLGAGGHDIVGCEGAGDEGILQNQPRRPECTGPSDRYIRDVASPDGSRDRNYSGSLSETFACIALLGDQGCGYEQPLEAMKRALSGDNDHNRGFLRDHALLAVVFVTDEDDCSARDPSLFAPNHPGLSWPPSSFRCFEAGVTCDSESPDEPGRLTGCRASESLFMDHVEPYGDFLRGLKSDPGMVMVASIAGDKTPVVVTLDPDTGGPELKPSCLGETSGSHAFPSVRLHDFMSGFPGRNQFASICADNMAGPLEKVATMVAGTSSRSPCLLGEVLDTDPAAGIQPECRVRYVSNPGTSNASSTEIARCHDSDHSDCYRLVSNSDICPHTTTQLALLGPETEGRSVVVECRTP